MWESFKKRVTNFIFEEIEEEETEEKPKEQVEVEDKEVKHNKRPLSRKGNQSSVKTRMTFEYPKEEIPISFPSYRDDISRVSNQSQLAKASDLSEQSVDNDIRDVKSSKNDLENDPRNTSIKRRKRIEKLENIPAYKRRRKETINDDEAEDDESIDRTQLVYSKPEELDALFKRKDAHTNHTEENLDIIDETTNKNELSEAVQSLEAEEKELTKNINDPNENDICNDRMLTVKDEVDETYTKAELDALFNKTVDFVFNEKRVSSSLLQKRFKIGYNQAAWLIDIMHKQGIISTPNNLDVCNVLITKEQWKHNHK